MDADASAPDGREVVEPVDRAAWRAWLEARHADSPSIWLLFHKQSSGRTGVSYEEAVEEALCFGWIDSRRNTLDEHRYIQLFAPRKPRGAWSRINKERIERLVAAGLMAPAGAAAIAAAKANGSWSTYDAAEDLLVPGDLSAALAADPEAQRQFDAFSPSSRKAILFWIASARRAPTREKRIAETVRLAAQGIRANHWQR